MHFKNGLEESGFTDNTNRFDDENKKAAKNIRSNQGYNIQSDVLTEQTTRADFIPNGDLKKASHQDNAGFVLAAHKAAENKENVINSTVNKGTVTSGRFIEDDKFIYFDKTDRKSGEFINDVFHDGHDKMAEKTIFSTVAGGAKIENHFTDKGKLTSDISLNQGKERTDRQEFKNKTSLFGDKIDDLFVASNFDKNEAAASYVDEYISKTMDRKGRKILKAAGRFSDIKSEANREIKSIKKEIKIDAREEKQQEKTSGSEERHLFKETGARFNELNDKFTDKHAKVFRGEMQDATGKSLFVIPAIKHTIKNRQDEGNPKNSHSTDEEKNIEKNIKSTVPVKEEVKNSSLTVQSPAKDKTVESYFTDSVANNSESTKDIPNRFMTKEERLEQEKAKKNAATKEKNKQLRRAATVAAVSNMFRMKKELQNDLGDMSGNSVTGDLIKDGRGSILSVLGSRLSRGIGNLGKNLLKKISIKIVSLLGAAFGSMILPLMIVLVCSLLLFVGYADSGEVYDLNLGGDGITHQSLTDDEIDGIINSLYETYNDPELGIYDMGSTQETILRYALSKVGCAYDQGKHWSLTEDIFDCSSLAMRSYREVGINIKNGDAFAASEECRALENQNKVVGNDLLPGDLIFYGGQNNGRYRGIYHVAIYVGNGKMVEARNSRMGVVYGDVRSNNVVICARPYR